ncbi:MAG TPA: VOC family protein [Verrucomicrobiota bacterium]|nr:VOC family protein [Verrucomicrobiota bacterium]
MTTPISTLVQPYLFFGGRCEEALEFYHRALGAEVELLLRHQDSPDSPPPGRLAAGWESKVMHASFRVGGSVLMASDGCSPEDGKFGGFSLSVTFPAEAEAQRAFAALAEGGQVQMPLMKTFWSPCFGMVTDRFGLGWMITISS